jgi:quercetin dioxygenase-like cupin family protein
MTHSKGLTWLATTAFLTLLSRTAWAQFEPSCARDSPERRGGVGCSLVEDKLLPLMPRGPLFWHIDRFDSGARAEAAVGPTSIALEAHGAWWLLSIESDTADHHSGLHVAQVELPALPSASRYSMLVMSAHIPAGLTSHVHHHSGVEAFYVVEGEQCLETQARNYKMPKGGSLAIPAGVVMRLVATGATPRRALAVIVYDSAQPPTMRMDTGGPDLVSCK